LGGGKDKKHGAAFIQVTAPDVAIANFGIAALR
jgi:hypothetical protein